jgi:hypothetical protein
MSENTDEKMKKERSAPVPAKRFIEVYQTSKSVAEAAATLGLEVHTVSQRASVYRKKRGINLKRFPSTATGGSRQDWKELAALADSLREEFDENEDEDSDATDDATEEV